MKCPNCRCIVPNNVSRCTYCGYDFMSGSAKTLTIEEAYKFITGLQIKILTEITFLPFWEKGVKFFIAQGPNLERLEFAQHIK